MLHLAKVQIMKKVRKIVWRTLQSRLVLSVNLGENELHLQQPITTVIDLHFISLAQSMAV